MLIKSMTKMDDIIIDQNILTDDEISLIKDRIVKNSFFPFYYTVSTSKFFAFSHNLVVRGDDKPNSPDFDFFSNILKRFISKHNIECTKVHRSAINISVENSQYTFVDPHVDHDFEHKTCLLYLNDLDIQGIYSKTIVFDINYKDTQRKEFSVDAFDLEHIPIKKIITPKMGKMVCFNGLNYHTMCYPKSNEIRYVVVFTIS